MPAACAGTGRRIAAPVRANNEDSFLALQFDAQEVHYLGKVGEASTGSTDFVFAVSDGMGGARAGEFASRITVDKITHLLPRSFKQAVLGLETDFEDIFTELYDQIHRALVFVGDSDEEIQGMQSTLSLCWFTPGWMYFAHIGDSRIYYLPASGKEIKQLSHDDTFVGWLYRNGQISERGGAPSFRAVPRCKRRSAAATSLSIRRSAQWPMSRGDMFLLCTDGLIEGLYDGQLLEMLRRPDAIEAAANPAQRACRRIA